MSKFNPDLHDGFREGGGAVKDGNLAIRQEKDSLLNYQQKLDVLAASIGVDKYTMLLASDIAKSSTIVTLLDNGKHLVTTEFSEMTTSATEIAKARSILPLPDAVIASMARF